MNDEESDAQMQMLAERTEALEIAVSCLMRGLKVHVPRAVPHARLYLLGSADRLEMEKRFIGARILRTAATRLTEDDDPNGSPTGNGRAGAPHLRRVK